MPEKLYLEGGKYTVINNQGCISVERYGKPWIPEKELPDSKWLLCLFNECYQLKEKEAESFYSKETISSLGDEKIKILQEENQKLLEKVEHQAHMFTEKNIMLEEKVVQLSKKEVCIKELEDMNWALDAELRNLKIKCKNCEKKLIADYVSVDESVQHTLRVFAELSEVQRQAVNAMISALLEGKKI